MPKIFLHCLRQIGEKFYNSVRWTSLAQPTRHMASTVNVFNSNNIEKKLQPGNHFAVCRPAFYSLEDKNLTCTQCLTIFVYKLPLFAMINCL